MTPEPDSLSLAPLQLPAFALNKVAEELRDQALAAAAYVSKVENAEENQEAVTAQAALKAFETLIGKATAPFIDQLNDHKKTIWRECDRILGRATNQTLVPGEVLAELNRIGLLLADFQKLEEAKARAAEKLKQEKLDQLERERAEAIAKVNNHDQLDAVQEKFNQKALDLSEQLPTPQPVRAKGQVVGHDWEITVTDPFKLATNHWHCVTVTPKVGEIKKLLDQGLTVQGVTARKVVKSTVRQPRERAAIAV